MGKQKVAAIVPALNEEKNIESVLKVLLNSKYLDEIIVVDDGSTDKTAKIAKNLGVKVISLKQNRGKANAMRKGLMSTDSEIIVFFDADLVGLSEKHIYSLVSPILRNEVVMSVGIRDRWWGLPKIIAKIFPVMFAIGGERAMKSFILKDIPKKFLDNVTDGIVMNYYCKINNHNVKFIDLKGLDIIVKEKKYGFLKGSIARLKMIIEFIKIITAIHIFRSDFIKK